MCALWCSYDDPMIVPLFPIMFICFFFGVPMLGLCVSSACLYDIHMIVLWYDIHMLALWRPIVCLRYAYCYPMMFLRVAYNTIMLATNCRWAHMSVVCVFFDWPMLLKWCSYYWPVIRLWWFRWLPYTCHMIFQCCSYGIQWFPMMFLWVSHVVPMVVLCFPHELATIVLWLSYGIPELSMHCYDCPICLWLPYDSPCDHFIWCPHDLNIVFLRLSYGCVFLLCFIGLPLTVLRLSYDVHMVCLSLSYAIPMIVSIISQWFPAISHDSYVVFIRLASDCCMLFIWCSNELHTVFMWPTYDCHIWYASDMHVTFLRMNIFICVYEFRKIWSTCLLIVLWTIELMRMLVLGLSYGCPIWCPMICLCVSYGCLLMFLGLFDDVSTIVLCFDIWYSSCIPMSFLWLS